jgi:hypothetical protein
MVLHLSVAVGDGMITHTSLLLQFLRIYLLVSVLGQVGLCTSHPYPCWTRHMHLEPPIAKSARSEDENLDPGKGKLQSVELAAGQE